MRLRAVTMAGLWLAAAVPAIGEAAPNGSAAERGRYLVNVMGCHDCHTPKTMTARGPEPDMSRSLSGHPETATLAPPPALGGGWIAATSADQSAWAGPWGISYAVNLTPDANTGLGIWTEDMWLKAMRTGRHMGTSRPMLPPMPWQALNNLDDADLKAVFAYLRTVPAVKNRVPDAVVAEPPPGAPRP